MFTQTAEYALRAAVALASREGSLTAAEIAAETQVPLQYLSKVLQGLNRAGLVTALRGKYGGYQLARPADQISVLDVLNATSPLLRIHHCPLGRPEHQAQLCPLHQQMDDAMALVEARLGASRLSDLTEPALPGLAGLGLGAALPEGGRP